MNVVSVYSGPRPRTLTDWPSPPAVREMATPVMWLSRVRDVVVRKLAEFHGINRVLHRARATLQVYRAAQTSPHTSRQ